MRTTTTTTREFDADGRCIKEVTVVETDTATTPERDDRVSLPYDPRSHGGHMQITPCHVYRTWNTAAS